MSEVPAPGIKIMTPSEIIKRLIHLIEDGRSVDKFIEEYGDTVLRVLKQRHTPDAMKAAMLKKSRTVPSQREMTILEQAVFDRLNHSLGTVVAKEVLIQVLDRHRPAPAEEFKKISYLYAIINELKSKAAARGFYIEAQHGVGYTMSMRHPPIVIDQGEEE